VSQYALPYSSHTILLTDKILKIVTSQKGLFQPLGACEVGSVKIILQYLGLDAKTNPIVIPKITKDLRYWRWNYRPELDLRKTPRRSRWRGESIELAMCKCYQKCLAELNESTTD
jgi:hypothetical protein